MGRLHSPVFNEWVEYVFTRGYAEFGELGPAVELFVDRIDDRVLAQHMIRLFEAPAFVADRYTDEADR